MSANFVKHLNNDALWLIGQNVIEVRAKAQMPNVLEELRVKAQMKNVLEELLSVDLFFGVCYTDSDTGEEVIRAMDEDEFSYCEVMRIIEWVVERPYYMWWRPDYRRAWARCHSRVRRFEHGSVR